MKAEHATWETGLVIPETAKPVDVQTLDALLRIEELLTRILESQQTLVADRSLAAELVEISTKSPADIIEQGFSEAPKKGKRK
jgi:citrate lyase beta subunit